VTKSRGGAGDAGGGPIIRIFASFGAGGKSGIFLRFFSGRACSVREKKDTTFGSFFKKISCGNEFPPPLAVGTNMRTTAGNGILRRPERTSSWSRIAPTLRRLGFRRKPPILWFFTANRAHQLARLPSVGARGDSRGNARVAARNYKLPSGGRR